MAGIGSWIAHPASDLSDPGVTAALSFLMFCTALCVGIGHVFYVQLRRAFHLRQTVEGQRAQLQELADRLSVRVHDQTEALRALHERAQNLRTEQQQEIARELHDGLGQELTSLRLLAGLGRAATPAGEARELFAELDGLVEGVQRNLRRVLVTLRPHLLDEGGLSEALQALMGDLERRSGLSMTLHRRDVPEPLPAPVTVALFRICQEGLTNVIRHARAEAVVVRLEGAADGIRLQIIDDGQGFDPQAISAGLGTRSITERAEALGGAADWLCGAGTTLTVTLPLEPMP